MDKQWSIIYYQSPQQQTAPVYKFIENLDSKAKSKVINTINLLEEYGTKLGLPHAKKLAGTNLWELRMLGQGNIRIIYVAIIGKNFLLLHGFNKKKQKTDKKEMLLASSRLKEYISRKNN